MPQVPVVIPDGPEIRARRLALGLSPEDFGKKIHRHPQTIRRIENGRQRFASDLLISQIARALRTETDTDVKQITRAITKDPAPQPAGIGS